MSSKIVVIGAVDGALKKVFSKLDKVHKKNNFAFAIFLGDLFGDDDQNSDLEDLIAGLLAVPLPSYFSIGNRSLPAAILQRLDAGQDVAPNLFFIGKRGVLKTSEGLRIVSLGGIMTETTANTSKYDPTYTDTDARALHGNHSADILLTNQWPEGITKFSQVKLPETFQPSQWSRSVSGLCTALKPSYHFSTSSNAFYQREPFYHSPIDAEASLSTTRFISLASVANPGNEKWLYAFSIDLSATTPTLQPNEMTPSPLTSPNKRKSLPDQHSSFSRFDSSNNYDSARSRYKRRRQDPVAGPEDCFFCLSNPTCATHLVTSIGEQSYLTVPKGPLPTASTFPKLGLPAHILILPQSHASTLATIKAQDDFSTEKTFTEMTKYRHALNKMIESEGKGSLGAVCWEVSREFVRHFHWQFLPAPVDMIREALVKGAFQIAAEQSHLPKFQSIQPDDIPEGSGDHFRVWIYTSASAPSTNPIEAADRVNGDEDSEGQEESMLMHLDASERFNIQFGRIVMGKLLGLENRSDWRDCGQTTEEEANDAENFKKIFEPFDDVS